MVEDNSIVINFPQGSGGHIVGRFLASCDNVVWYDHSQNGEHPWIPYTLGSDHNFSRLHFNKRFKGAIGKGICKHTVTPVLDMAEKQNVKYKIEDINKWKQQVYPQNLLYTLHADLNKTKEFFKKSKFVVIIPEDIDLLIDRWMKSTYYYYVDPKRKDFLYRDLYEEKSKKLNLSIQECLQQDFIRQLNNYKKYSNKTDIVIDEAKKLYDIDFFKDICNKLSLTFNQDNYKKVLDLAKKYSHL